MRKSTIRFIGYIVAIIYTIYMFTAGLIPSNEEIANLKREESEKAEILNEYYKENSYKIELISMTDNHGIKIQSYKKDNLEKVYSDNGKGQNITMLLKVSLSEYPEREIDFANLTLRRRLIIEPSDSEVKSKDISIGVANRKTGLVEVTFLHKGLSSSNKISPLSFEISDRKNRFAPIKTYEIPRFGDDLSDRNGVLDYKKVESKIKE